MKSQLKGLLILGLIIFGLMVFILSGRLGKQTNPSTLLPSPRSTEETNQAPKIISTKPDPLDQALISGSEVIEITFNKPLENAPELRLKIDPKVDIKVELSSDRQTAKLIPVKAYELGTDYTLFISPESKFDGGQRLDGEKIYHFHTVKYRGV